MLLVRYGSKAEVTARHDEVCFTPETGHRLKFMGTRPSLALTSAKGATQFAFCEGLHNRRQNFQGCRIRTGAKNLIAAATDRDVDSSCRTAALGHRYGEPPPFARKGPNDFEVDFDFCLLAATCSQTS
jgi:hypothetical protein